MQGDVRRPHFSPPFWVLLNLALEDKPKRFFAPAATQRPMSCHGKPRGHRTEGIREKTPDVFVEVSPELAEERGIQSGTWVQLTSRYGQVQVRALVTGRVRGRELYMPMTSTQSPVNRLTSSHTRSCHEYACLQGIERSNEGPGRSRGKPAASH
jgi:predicted molibdopterin-dependent oxidoreductase YjgC